MADASDHTTTARPGPGPRPAAPNPLVRLISPLQDFLRTESAGGILLIAAAVVALVWANSPWSGSYRALWDKHLSLGFDGHVLDLSLRHWVNDALMALFFLVVGLEIKREVTGGHLAEWRAAMLPGIAALGGMVVPALVYLAVAGGSHPRGWGVPMATDIALAVGVLAVLGKRVPAAWRAFLLGLAIVDDIGAIVVIAVFYSSGVSLWWLALAVVMIAVAGVVRAMRVQSSLPFWILGTVCWLALHHAGIHPTLAGVAMGLLAPSTPHLEPQHIDIEELTDLSSPHAAHDTSLMARHSVSVVEWMLHRLHPLTSFVIVPLFALANSGIELSSTILADALGSTLTWGIFAGLVLGKPLGIVVSTRLATATRMATPIEEGGGRTVLGVGAAAGIGFTVAMFIAELAFTDRADLAQAKLAILVASVVSGVIAVGLLRRRPG